MPKFDNKPLRDNPALERLARILSGYSTVDVRTVRCFLLDPKSVRPASALRIQEAAAEARVTLPAP